MEMDVKKEKAIRESAKQGSDKYPMESVREKLAGTAIRILLVILLIVTGYLAYQGIRYSYFSSINPNESIFRIQDSTFKHLCVFVTLSIMAAVFLRLFEKAPRHQEKICMAVLLIACIWMAVSGFLYLRQHPYYPVGDQFNTTAGSVYAREGRYFMFQKGGYIGLYEQQKGFLFLYEIFFSVFGDFRYDIAAWFHLALNIITLCAGYSFLKIVAKKPVYRIFYSICMMFCVPYLLYLPYIYGDLPSICFSMVMFWALAAYEQKKQKKYVVIAAVAGALALLERMNIWIVLIAVGIGVILSALKKGSFRPVLAGLCVILAAAFSVKAVNLMYEYRSGYESGIGMPSILWISMGLQETEGVPGVYNHYQQDVFAECNYDREAATEVAKADIAEILQKMRKDPNYANWFFRTKVRMQWQEPLFESLYSTGTFSETADIPEGIKELYYGKYHNPVWMFANYYQSMIYLAVFSFVVISILRKGSLLTKSCIGWIPLIAVVGGFLFSIMWESQCRYVLPYYLYLLLYASVGMGKLAEIICCLGKQIYLRTKTMPKASGPM